MSEIPAHSLVRLLSDHDQILEGAVGHVVESFGKTYEVEFYEEEVVRILVEESELMSVEPNEDRCS